ncbi:MAG: anthranilate synthase component II, partial [Acidimicrobiales bacterium]
YNLVQYLGELGAEPVVLRNDAVTAAQAEELEVDGLVISPGPGRPEAAGASMEVLAALGARIPTLGVCLGHQCIGALYGWTVERSPVVMHGKTSLVHHDGRGVLAGLPDPFEATRYHSLVVSRESAGGELVVSAESEDGLVMGLRHRELPVEGVQFHPESVLSGGGKRLVGNFIGAVRTAAEKPAPSRRG